MWWKVLLIAATPILELRGALPIAIFQYDMPFWQAYVLSVAGNVLPVLPLLFLLSFAVRVAERHIPSLHRALRWWFERTKKRFGPSYELYGTFALFVFVAIPLPLTGAWSGAVAAVLFQIPPRLAFPAIALGVAASGLLVGLFAGVISLAA